MQQFINETMKQFNNVTMNKSNIKSIIFSISLLFVSVFSNSQDIVFGHAEFIHGSGKDKVADLHIDSEGNLYMAGSFENEGNIGGVAVERFNAYSAFIVKYSPDGMLQYTKHLSGTGDITVHSVCSDSENNLYVTGTFRKICTIGNKSLTSTDYQDNYIVKISPEGNFLWTEHIFANTKDETSVLLCDNEDNLYFAGTFYKTITVENKELKSESSSDIFISKFNKQGKLINLQGIHGKNKDILSDIACSDDNRLFITGTFTDNIDFIEKKLISEGRKDIFLAEIEMNATDQDLKFISEAIQIGGYYDDYPKKLKIFDNRIYLLGAFRGELKTDKNELISNGALDAFVACYKLNGKEQWAESFGGASEDYPHSMVINTKGNIYVTGNYRGSMEVESKAFQADIKTKELQNDNYLIKLNNKGEIIKLVSFGGDDNDFPVETVISKDNILYHTGTFRSDFNFGKIKSNIKSKNNIFLTEIYDCDNTQLNLGEDVEYCGSDFLLSPDIEYETYIWSNGSTNKETVITSSGKYNLTVIDKYGCTASDEIYITLHDIPMIDLGEDLIVKKGSIISLSAEAGFAEYIWNNMPSTNEITIQTRDMPAGEYTYTLQVTNDAGCTSEDIIRINVTETQDISVINETKKNEADNNETTVEYVNNNNKTTIEKEQKHNSIRAELVPNPNNGKFMVYITNTDEKEDVIYELYSPTGKLIYKKTSNKKEINQQEQFNIQSKAKGSYMLKIINGTSVLNKVIIVSEK